MNEDRIKKSQLKHLIRPIVYVLLLVTPEGLTIHELVRLLNSTPGLRRFKLDVDKLGHYLRDYKSGRNLSVFIQKDHNWFIRELVGGYKC
jgi:hypothetical protein